MTVIEIPFNRIKDCDHDQFMIINRASNYALGIALWCREQGLKMNDDFEWAVKTEERKLVFSFFNNAEKFASIVALKFGDGHG